MNQLSDRRNNPRQIFLDNDSELIPNVLDKWTYEHQVTLAFSRAGKPMSDSAYETRWKGYHKFQGSR